MRHVLGYTWRTVDFVPGLCLPVSYELCNSIKTHIIIMNNFIYTCTCNNVHGVASDILSRLSHKNAEMRIQDCSYGCNC